MKPLEPLLPGETRSEYLDPIGEVLVRAFVVENAHGRMIKVGGVFFAFDELEIVKSEKPSDISDIFGPNVGSPTEKPIKGIDTDDGGF